MALLAPAACSILPHGTPPQTLEGTHWRAIKLSGLPASRGDTAREPHLQFLEGDRVSGSDGCNRITGSYWIDGGSITFEHIAATQMACLDSPGTEAPFRNALESAARFALAGDFLELFDAMGRGLAVFEGAAATP
jgi:heat shock protein HslJ